VAFPGLTTLGAVRLAAKRRANMERSSFLSDPEWDANLVASQQEEYDLLVTSYGENYYVATSYTFTTVAGQELYALPSDFYKSLFVEWVQNPGDANQNILLYPYNRGERNTGVPGLPFVFGTRPCRYRFLGNNISLRPVPQAGMQIQLWYVPRLTVPQDSITIGLQGVTVGQSLIVNVPGWSASFLAWTSYSPGSEFLVGNNDADTAASLAQAINTAANIALPPNGVLTATSYGPTVTLTLNDNAPPMTLSVSGPSSFSFSSTSVNNQIDGVNGWEEFIVVDAAIKALEKAEYDTSTLMVSKAALLKRIEDAATNRDTGAPMSVSDVYGQLGGYPGGSW
jgi:hypothetical protein